jgi:hypothetical protein
LSSKFDFDDPCLQPDLLRPPWRNQRLLARSCAARNKSNNLRFRVGMGLGGYMNV